MNLAPFVLGLLWGFFRKVPLYAVFSRRFNWQKLGILLKRRFHSSFRKHFRVYPFLILSFLIGTFRQYPILSDRFGDAGWYPAVWVSFALAQYGFLLYFLFRNRFKPGIWMILVGTLLNGLVIVANGGQMPVGSAVEMFGAAAADSITAAPHYMLASAETRLALLSDQIPFWLLGWFMISIGDFPIMIGIFRLAKYLPRRIVRKNPSEVDLSVQYEYTEER